MTAKAGASRSPTLWLTPGEPAGIGPDLVLSVARHHWRARVVAIADPELLRERARQLGVAVEVSELEAHALPPPHVAGRLVVQPVRLRAPCRAGVLDPANAAYVLETLRAALARLGPRAALVTGPVHKGIINEAGIAFSGHTEFLAEQLHAQTPQFPAPVPVMMLVARRLRVALATTHLPLRAVPDALDAENLETVLRILLRELRTRFRIERPRVLVCGLNPHAGESGHLGREEITIIQPVLDRLRAEGFQVVGPLPADTLFVPARLRDADAVLAMYHDQGLPVLKHAGFGKAVNVTLGLPVVRTSVDHGTALELAGSGRADDGSLRAAMQLALRLIPRGAGAQR